MDTMNEPTKRYIKAAQENVPPRYLKYSESRIEERIMRLGIEVRGLGCGPEHYREVAIASLALDFKNQNPHLCLGRNEGE